MIDYKLWQQRLIDELMPNPAIKKIGFAADIKSVLKSVRKNKGTIHIVPGADSLDGAADTTQHNRTITKASVQVLTIARDYSDATGDGAMDKAKTITDLIYNALQGWTASDCIDSAHYKGAKPMGFLDGFVMWLETYETLQLRTPS